jgi:hypothetical protein
MAVFGCARKSPLARELSLETYGRAARIEPEAAGIDG